MRACFTVTVAGDSLQLHAVVLLPLFVSLSCPERVFPPFALHTETHIQQHYSQDQTQSTQDSDQRDVHSLHVPHGLELRGEGIGGLWCWIATIGGFGLAG